MITHSSIGNDAAQKLIPVLSETEKQEMLTYFTVYEKYQKEFSERMTEDLKDHLVFGKLIRNIPKEVSEASNRISHQLQRNAIIKNEWLPYIEYQIEMGITYAKMGLDFRSWFEVVALVKNYLRPILFKEYGGGEAFLSSLMGMNRFMDIAMGIIGEAYMQEKQEIIRQEGEKIKKLNVELEQKIKEILNYKYALDESSIIAITDQKGIIKEVNTNFCNISKYSREELIGQDHRIVNSGYHPIEFIRDLWVTIASGKIWRGELKNKAKDGTIYWVDTTIVPFLNEQGKPFQYLAIRSDITKRKKVEDEIKNLNDELEQKVIRRTRQLAESEEKLRVVLDSAHIGAWDLNLVKDTTWRSLLHDQIFGYDQLLPEWGYEIFIKHVIPEDRDYVKQRFEEAYSKGKFSMECRIQRVNDHSIRWISAQGLAYKNEKGELEKMMGIVIDITHRKEAEHQLLDLNTELDAFSYSISHDLRAPLRIVNGYADVLIKEHTNGLTDEGKRLASVIDRNAKRMGQLIDDLLEFSHLGKKKIEKHAVDMNKLVHSVLAEKSSLIGDGNAEIKTGALPDANCDPNLMRQVWINLLSNAFKYSSKKENAVVEIGTLNNSDEITFFVRDNGVGFDMKYADKLFGVFQRLHNLNEFEGTGVGLATVHRIISKHGGRIWAEAEEKKGATFYFSLPA